MAQASISGGNPVEAVHTRTSATGGDSQVACIGIDGSDSVVLSHATRGLRVDSAATNIATGIQQIAIAANGPFQLNNGVSFACKSMFVCALQQNTEQVCIGDNVVNADASLIRGIPLQPGQGVSLDIGDVSSVYLDVLGNNHGVTYTVLY